MNLYSFIAVIASAAKQSSLSFLRSTATGLLRCARNDGGRLLRNFLVVMLIIPLQLLAAEDYYSFSTPIQQHRFESLTSQLRCVVCQNQTIAESNAGIANDLREQIYQKILTGQSDKEIVTFLTDRYGSYILYQPPMNLTTLVLWLGPLLILFSGLGFLFFYLRKHKGLKSC